jgi:hypothetical protein
LLLVVDHVFTVELLGCVADADPELGSTSARSWDLVRRLARTAGVGAWEQPPLRPLSGRLDCNAAYTVAVYLA